MTEKKNQHYIPKFYLKKFSYKGNEKQIGLFNIKTEFFYQNATLKNQGSKNFFYGADGIVEESLSVIEGKLAQSLKKIIETLQLPEKNSKEHVDLLKFVALTHLRNPVLIENAKDLIKTVLLEAKELDANVDVTKFLLELEHDDAITMALSELPNVVRNMVDLEYKFLINRTKLPFITSDFPVLKYNQFLEMKKWVHGKTAYGNTGLQIIVPLNDELAIMFYDSRIYNVGGKMKNYLGITKEKDVRQLNVLQLLNCFEHVYFNEKMHESEIRELSTMASNFIRPNIIQSTSHYLFDGKTPYQPRKENLIITGNTDLEIKLKIDGIRISSVGKNEKLSSSVAQLRSLPMMLKMQE